MDRAQRGLNKVLSSKTEVEKGVSVDKNRFEGKHRNSYNGGFILSVYVIFLYKLVKRPSVIPCEKINTNKKHKYDYVLYWLIGIESSQKISDGQTDI